MLLEVCAKLWGVCALADEPFSAFLRLYCYFSSPLHWWKNSVALHIFTFPAHISHLFIHSLLSLTHCFSLSLGRRVSQPRVVYQFYVFDGSYFIMRRHFPQIFSLCFSSSSSSQTKKKDENPSCCDFSQPRDEALRCDDSRSNHIEERSLCISVWLFDKAIISNKKYKYRSRWDDSKGFEGRTASKDGTRRIFINRMEIKMWEKKFRIWAWFAESVDC